MGVTIISKEATKKPDLIVTEILSCLQKNKKKKKELFTYLKIQSVFTLA